VSASERPDGRRKKELTKIFGQAKSISETVERYLTAPPTWSVVTK
jgi:hypothetical protein